MPQVVQGFESSPAQCAYLPQETATLEYRVILDISPMEWQSMLERGWRRFGMAYFRPRCRACQACVPLRLEAAAFTPGKGQKRVLRRGRDFRLERGPALVDPDRIALYNAWHESQGNLRGWDGDEMTQERYFREFVLPHSCLKEYAHYDGTKLIALALVDETPDALSAIYTYYDPSYARFSLGTFSVLRQIETALQLGKKHVYLGYRILGCKSSEYKQNYRPHELLEGYPEADQATVWRSAAGPA